MELRFAVKGMTCAACSARVEKVARNVAGVTKAEVNLLKGTMRVEAENKNVADAIISAVSDAGYQASVAGQQHGQDKQDNTLNELRQRILLSGCCLLVLMYFTMGHMFGLPVPAWYSGRENAAVAALLQLLLTLPVVYWNRVYYIKGFKALYRRSPNMDSLIAVGSAAALIYGIAALFRISYSIGHGDWNTVMHYRENLYFESAAMILTLITIGKFLESRAKGKTGDAIRQLMDLRPKTAVVIRDGVELEVPVDQVVVGDRVVVRSGQRIAVDGTVMEGRGAVDQSALTGESVPIEKTVGDTVSAATINTEGYLLIRADKIGEDTTLAQVIALVEEASGSKAPIARLADQIAGVFVPVVMGIAAITFCVWMLIGNGLEFALTAGISVLVISCPCALGLATPVAIMVGTGRGASLGVLFKNAEVLERLHKVDTVVLDKTGTLTKGQPEITDVIPADTDELRLLSIAAALEEKSEHPFAKAIINYNGNKPFEPATDFQTLPGHGVSGVINGVRYYGGNQRLMESIGISVLLPDISQFKSKTPLYFASEHAEYLGCLIAADVLKEDSYDAVKAMKQMGLDVVMLTGDNKDTAASIAESAGISHVIADVLPGDKAGAVEELRASGHVVLMVGDGINDAPALVSADVGAAVGAGTDIAIESAGVVLMNSSLTCVCAALELSKATMRNIRQNLFWAFFYNSLGIPLAAGVLFPAFGILLSPMIGAAAMSMSSFFVVSNALRLRLFKPKVSALQFVNTAETELKNMEEYSMETVIHVEGMMCPHCKARVESVCKAVPGTKDAVVDLEQKQVTVTGDASVELLKKAITDAGYEVISK